MAVAEMVITGGMLRSALESSDTPAKSLAQDSNYSVDAIYAAINGKRRIPREARQNISKMHPMGGLAVAFEGTGYNLFRPIKGDMHPQNILQKAIKEDREADEHLDKMGFRLIDKQRPEDLTDDDRFAIRAAAKELIEEIRAKLSLLVVWENQFEIQLVKMLTEDLDKEKAALNGATR